MIKWRKLGKVFPADTKPSRPWFDEFAQAPSSLIFDDVVRIYFSCRPSADSSGQYVSYSAWVDFDRKNLFSIVDVAKNPILELGEVGTFDEYGIYPVSVVRNGHDIYAYYGGWTRCESVPFNVAIGLAISKDGGNTFRRAGLGPIFGYSPDEPFIISGPKIRFFNNKWYMYYIAGKKWIIADGRAEPIYKIRMAISNDGLNWDRANKDLIPTIFENEAQASPDVYYSNGKYHMFFCYRHGVDYRNKSRGYRIGYAFSTDLLNWTRNDSMAGIDVSDNGWDSEMISYPHVFKVDQKIYMAYLGNGVGKEGFGVAVLEGQLE